MNKRLAGALIEHIQARVQAGEMAWILIEGPDVALATELLEGWPENELPKLFIVGPSDADFGDSALGDASATSKRNANGVCLVLCEGQRISDYQSIRGFERHSLSDLVSDEDALQLILRQEPSLPQWDGSVLKQAIFDPKLVTRPSVRSVARFVDAVASGADTGKSMPFVGGFRDVTDEGFKTHRLIENLNLASGRSAPELLRPASLGEIRTRAERRLAGSFDDPLEAAARVVEMLQSGTDDLLSYITFDEARDILEEPPASELPEQVKRDLETYRRSLDDEADRAPIERFIALVDDLTDPYKAKGFATELLDYDANENERVFRVQTRRRLRALLRERRLTVEAIEDGLIRGLSGLASTLTSVELKEPGLVEEPSSEAQAKSVLARAAAHVRLAPLLHALREKGVDVSGDLLLDPADALRAALDRIDRPNRLSLRRVAIVLRGESRSDSVEISWTPAMEDLVLLLSMAKFAAGPPVLTLESALGRDDLLSFSGLSQRTVPTGLDHLAKLLRDAARAVLERGYEQRALVHWAGAWAQVVRKFEKERVEDQTVLEALALAGSISFSDGEEVAFTSFSPLKSEWVAARTEAWLELLEWAMSGDRAEGDELEAPISETARALAKASSAQYPAFLASPNRAAPTLATADGKIFSAFGERRAPSEVAPPPVDILENAIRKLADLHPEARGHFRCIAWQDSGCDLAARALRSVLTGPKLIERAELFCVDGGPNREILEELDAFARGDDQGRIAIRYLDNFGGLNEYRGAGGAPVVHLAVVSGITEEGRRLQLDTAEIGLPPHNEDVLFTPKTWVRANKERRILLSPPTVSDVGGSWLRLMTAISDTWPDEEELEVRVPELRTDPSELRRELIELHELALWVVTIDRYASRDSLESALGDEVAILHQEKRITGSSPEGLVISQKSGGSADRAIARSLRASGLADEADASQVAAGLRKSASRGYGILALRAATTGSGINELLGQVCAFARLGSAATPWPLPEGCRVLLLSLDEYRDWFGRGKRADMLALALSPAEEGVHLANLEVKAVKTTAAAVAAGGEAKEQLRKTLNDSRFAARPNGSLFSRLWLNRIAEAAVGVSRENRFRLGEDDLAALETFRLGGGTLEWAGVGMVFRPGPPEASQRAHHRLMSDLVPIVITSTPLTRELLHEAAETDPTHLRTAEAGRPALVPSTKERRVGFDDRPQEAAVAAAPEEAATYNVEPVEVAVSADVEPAGSAIPTVVEEHETETEAEAQDGVESGGREGAETVAEAVSPELGRDWETGEVVEWRVIGQGALSNGHVEIYGTSGAGKTQFIKSLLSQLHSMGSHFGVCDFKNDYGDDFPERTGAKFYDLWNETVPYNPLATDNPTRRSLQGLTIELRDTVDIAARAFTRLGHRQLHKLQEALESAYEEKRRTHNAFPTLSDLHEHLDDDLRGVIGDLTATDLFGEGPPLGDLIGEDVIFGLNHIPGTGLTTTLSAGFILASLYLELLEMPQVFNEVSYTLAIDEAHRVASFHSVGSMVRELRSKGLAVILATQRPGDLPGEAGTNAQTKIYMRLPDAQSATSAARNLDPTDRNLPKAIRSLGDGEAFVALAGGPPRLVKLRQFWRDH
jgi:Helicase HerA-like C-terminal